MLWCSREHRLELAGPGSNPCSVIDERWGLGQLTEAPPPAIKWGEGKEQYPLVRTAAQKE